MRSGFGATRVRDGLDPTVATGEVHGLLGSDLEWGRRNELLERFEPDSAKKARPTGPWSLGHHSHGTSGLPAQAGPPGTWTTGRAERSATAPATEPTTSPRRHSSRARAVRPRLPGRAVWVPAHRRPGSHAPSTPRAGTSVHVPPGPAAVPRVRATVKPVPDRSDTCTTCRISPRRRASRAAQSTPPCAARSRPLRQRSSVPCRFASPVDAAPSPACRTAVPGGGLRAGSYG